jgi:hypothetical protein
VLRLDNVQRVERARSLRQRQIGPQADRYQGSQLAFGRLQRPFSWFYFATNSWLICTPVPTCPMPFHIVHRGEDLLKPGGEIIHQQLLRWKAEGKTDKIGVSVYDEQELELILQQFRFDIVQLPVNVLDQRLL